MLRHIRQLASVLAILSFTACPGSFVVPPDSSPPQDSSPPPDANDVARTCPSPLSPGGACASEGQNCTAPEQCIQCAHALWSRWARPCTCTSGHWQCAIGDCFAPGPGIYADPSCTIPSVMDAGSDATVDAIDAGPVDACPGIPDVSPFNPDGDHCGVGLTLCGSQCVNTQYDQQNCGACGRVCAAYQLCSNGTCGCECAAGLTTCSGPCGACMCTDLQHDSTHCGSCTTSCAAGQVCVSGICQ